jgi:hypothetical protein
MKHPKQKMRGVTSQKTPFSIVTAVKTSNLISKAVFLAANPEVPGSIPGATRLSE